MIMCATLQIWVTLEQFLVAKITKNVIKSQKITNHLTSNNKKELFLQVEKFIRLLPLLKHNHISMI